MSGSKPQEANGSGNGSSSSGGPPGAGGGSSYDSQDPWSNVRSSYVREHDEDDGDDDDQGRERAEEGTGKHADALAGDPTSPERAPAGIRYTIGVDADGGAQRTAPQSAGGERRYPDEGDDDRDGNADAGEDTGASPAQARHDGAAAAGRHGRDNHRAPGDDFNLDHLPEIYTRAWRLAAQTAVPGAGASDVVADDDDNDDDEDGDRGSRFGGGHAEEISLAQLHRVVSLASLGATKTEEIVNLACKGSRCSRSELAVALIMAAQAQQGVVVDAESAHTALLSASSSSASVPVPELRVPATPSPPRVAASSISPSSASAKAVGDAGDPWTSPSGLQPGLYGAEAIASVLPASESTLGSAYRAWGGGVGVAADPTALAVGTTGASTSSLGGATGEAPHRPDMPAKYRASRTVLVRLKPETGGFLFVRHTLYTVHTKFAPGGAGAAAAADDDGSRPASRTSGKPTAVTRRYSDFDWLADCLAQKYPFRTLPVLPPKRYTIPVAGKHLTAEDGFTEQRRRGLQRFCRALQSHPVLRKDPLVVLFFTEQQSIAEWRASHPSVELGDESFDAAPTEAERESIGVPGDIDEKWAKVRGVTPMMLERWQGLVTAYDRLTKRTEALSGDHSRVAFAISSLVQESRATWKPEGQVWRAEELMERMGHAETDFADVLGAKAQAMTSTILEGLKAQRDLWQSFHSLCGRLHRSTDNVESLKRRIGQTTKRLALAQTERKPGWEAETARLAKSIEEDKARIEALLRRRTKVKAIQWEELQRLYWLSQAVETTLRQSATTELSHTSATCKAAEELVRALMG